MAASCTRKRGIHAGVASCRTPRFSLPAFAGFLACVLVVGCSYYHGRSPREKLRYEEKVGREFALEASAQLRLLDEPEVLDFIKRLGHLIASNIPGSVNSYTFFVIRDPSMNAFSVPGGYVYMYLGLLTQVQSIDELAGVIAHEIAHVEANHFLRGQKKMEVANIATLASIILAAVLGGGEQAAAAGTLAQAAQISTQLHYSREFEREADLKAIGYLNESGFSPQGMVDLFETFYAKARLNADDVPPYFYTHPLPAERVNEVRAWMMSVRHSGRAPRPALSGFDLARVTAALRLDDSDRTINEQRKALEEKTGQADTMFLLGYLYLKKGDLVPAIEMLEQVYNRQPGRAECALYLGRAYFLAGRVDQAADLLERAARLDPSNHIAQVFIGDLLSQQDKIEPALDHYKKALLLDPESSFAHTALGLAYGRLEEPGICYYHLGMADKLAGRYLKALHYFKKAKKYIDPKREEAVQVAREIRLMEG